MMCLIKPGVVCRHSQGAEQVTRRPAALRPGFQPAAGRSHSCPNGMKAEKRDEQQMRRQQLTQTAPAVANTQVPASPCFACGVMPGICGCRLCKVLHAPCKWLLLCL